MKNDKDLLVSFLVILLFTLPACSTKASFASKNNVGPVKLAVDGQQVRELPTSLDIRGTTFGQYSFTATDDHTKLNGLLPLKVQPARIVLDILFFAPALFFNIQAACNSYVFDMDSGVVECEYRGKRQTVNAVKTAMLP